MNEIIPRKRNTIAGRVWTRRINNKIYPFNTFIDGILGIVSPSLDFYIIANRRKK